MILKKIQFKLKAFIRSFDGYRVSLLTFFGRPKVFGIGANKTGTTSLEAAMGLLGYKLGNQRKGENLIEEWATRDFRKIIKHSRTADFFQDAPFSFPFTYIVLDQKFPNSKFILTVRDSPEQWYNSLLNFHSKIYGQGNIPDKKALQNATYIYKGRPWRTNRLKYTTPENDPYNKESLITNYEIHNNSVKEYFRHRPDDLLVLNISDSNAMKLLCDFLKIPQTLEEFPWENKT